MMQRALFSIILVCFSMMFEARAETIAIGVADDIIAIDANFAGAPLTLFGAITDGEDPIDRFDIIATIEGPKETFIVRKIERRGVIWTPGEALEIPGAPRFYATIATGDISNIAPVFDQKSRGLGAAASLAAHTGAGLSLDGQAAQTAFLNDRQQRGLYGDVANGIEFIGDQLFKIRFDLPASTPVGDYRLSAYLYRDGVLLSEDDATLSVQKVGLERRIYDLARDRPISYGLICVVMSLFAGWMAGLVFHK